MGISNEHYEAQEAASDVRAFMASYGADCEVLPAGDRVVIHIPLQSVTDLVTASRIRGHLVERTRRNLEPV
jgi:hypothetical protein